MKKQLLSISVVLAMVLNLLIASVAYAEDTNRNEVRSQLSEGWDGVIWGDLINEADYALFIKAVIEVGITGNPAPLYAYFDGQLEAQVNKISAQAPEIGKDVLVKLLIQAFKSNGGSLRQGRLEISAGLATYKRWNRVVYDEPGTYPCRIRGPFHTWTRGVCLKKVRVEKNMPLPNNFQPYFRFRWVK